MARATTYSHGADVGISGEGATVGEAFEAAGLALTSVICDPALVAARERIALRCEAPDLEDLLFDWINALVLEMNLRRMLFGKFSVRIEGSCLHAEAWGEALDLARHEPAAEVKGATYTDLHVRQTAPDHWVARCIVDV